MAFFSSHHAKPRYVALLDIGSASVTASIAYSGPDGNLEILWSTQERILLKHIKSETETGKHIMSTFMSVILDMGQSGLQKMREHYSRAVIDVLQISIAAPWSYTITKEVNYQKDTEFPVTNTLYGHLLDSMEDKVQSELQEHEVADHLGLTVVSRSITGLRANGYPIEKPNHQKARTVSLALSNTVIQNYLYDMIQDAHAKVLPKSELRVSSFVLLLYYVLRDIHPEMQEYCLINQTLEATELGIVRNGQLCYSTHEPSGTVTIARELADIFAVAIDEMYGIIHSGVWEKRYADLSASKQANADSVLESYQETVSELLKQTGDSFTVPKTIYMHTASCSYGFFGPHIERGAELATGLAHIVHNIDEELLALHTGLNSTRPDRSCVELISAYYFHTHQDGPRLISY